MSLEARRPAPSKENRPSPENKVAAKQPNGDSLPSLPAYAVLLIAKYGMPKRKVYLNLDHAQAAVAKARDEGKPARLVLCELRVVQADLDVDEVTE